MILHYQTLGSSSHPPLLFTHGLGASASQTTSSLTELNNRWLIAPDMPGHGQSLDYDSHQFSFDYFADQAIALLDHLEIESTDLGGLSMGSGIALNLTLRYPERVKKLIILRPSWLNKAEPSHLDLVAQIGKWIADDPLTAHSNLERFPEFRDLAKTNPPVAQSLVALFSRPQDSASTEVLFRMWQSAPFDSLNSLSEIQNPCLILDTTQDELHPQEVAQTYAKHLPNSIYHTLPPRYHDNPSYQNELNLHLNQFLSLHY